MKNNKITVYKYVVDNYDDMMANTDLDMYAFHRRLMNNIESLKDVTMEESEFAEYFATK